MSVVDQLGLMLGVLAVGAALRAVGVLTPTRRDRLTALAFYVALPALVFASTVEQSLSDVLSWRLLLGVTVVLLAVAGLSLALHRHRADPAKRGSPSSSRTTATWGSSACRSSPRRSAG
ncbi:hypothetical protein N0B31_00120 [Salinirubellus salinus]|uniref:Uncharacterized protein n=1 Tax=Salinirubellus salinus TaxID=1364945 RepID=A0A9E7R362_9EURY|nr:hypothetical protein [Salinirubellus salinus]UWM54701.1 hypothetical protein N0B31_00120 [Salinirubellus salinus]